MSRMVPDLARSTDGRDETPFTEREWREGRSLNCLLDYVQTRSSARKLRLFGAGCCRRILHLLTDERARQVLDVVERYADGDGEARDLVAVQRQAGGPHWTPPWPAVWHLSAPQISVTAVSGSAAMALGWVARSNAPMEQELLLQIQLAQCVFGNPFRSPEGNAAWRTANVLGVAQAVYANHDGDRLPILGDALEEAGCASAIVLDHCRGGGPHARGCWVVDYLLAKEP